MSTKSKLGLAALAVVVLLGATSFAQAGQRSCRGGSCGVGGGFGSPFQLGYPGGGYMQPMGGFNGRFNGGFDLRGFPGGGFPGGGFGAGGYDGSGINPGGFGVPGGYMTPWYPPHYRTYPQHRGSCGPRRR